MADWVAVLLGVGGPLSFVVTIVTLIQSRRKVSAEAADIYRRAASGMMDDLHTELEWTRREMSALREHLRVVEGLLLDSGVPVPPFHWPVRHPNNGRAG